MAWNNAMRSLLLNLHFFNGLKSKTSFPVKFIQGFPRLWTLHPHWLIGEDPGLEKQGTQEMWADRGEQLREQQKAGTQNRKTMQTL